MLDLILVSHFPGLYFSTSLAGGMILYVSLVDMVPQLDETVDETAKPSAAKAVFFLQNLSMLAGIVCLFVLARLQDDNRVSLQ